jgi:4-hydroxybenzoate polyprenyltransferase
METTFALSGLLLTGIFLPVAIGLWLAPALTRALLGDLRVPRILHYVALAGIGWMLFHRDGLGPRVSVPLPSLDESLVFAILVISLTYAAIAAIITNNLEDLAADRISNPHRPLASGAVAPRPYLVAGICCEIIALALAAACDWRMFWGVLGISAGYFVYSCRPLRLKRIPILSKALIGLNSWLVAGCGFTLAGGDPMEFPMWWSVWIIGPMSLAANFVDLKDTAGDGATRVWTLPVLLGESRARHVIALATLLSYGMAARLLWPICPPWVLPLNVGAAAAHVFFLYRRPYDERWVFLVYVGALYGLIFLLFFGQSLFS